MTAIGKIDAVYREKTFPVEAVKLYTDVNRHSRKPLRKHQKFGIVAVSDRRICRAG